MSAHTIIDPRAAVRTRAPDLPAPIGDEVALTWVCPICGKLRAFEGGRPLGTGRGDDCEECGSRLAVEEQPAFDTIAFARARVRASMDRYLS